MLTKIRVFNFQGFLGNQEVRVAPITLIFGPNASGKSSISRAMRLMSQSWKQPSESISGPFRYNASQINLGSLKNTIFGQLSNESLPKVLGLGFGAKILDVETKLRGLKSISIFSYDDVEGTLSLRHIIDFELDNSMPEFANFSELKIAVVGKEMILISPDDEASSNVLNDLLRLNIEHLTIELFQKSGGLPNQEVMEEVIKVLRNDPLAEVAPWDQIFKSFTVPGNGIRIIDKDEVNVDTDDYSYHFESREFDDIDVQRQKLLVIELVELAADKQFAELSKISRIEPLREIPPVASLERKGMFFEASNRQLDLANKWLSRLTSSRYQIERQTDQISNSQFSFTVLRVKDSFTGANVAFQDVGVGISQLLPVLLGCASFLEKRGTARKVITSSGSSTAFSSKILIVEQPELHLHPKAQGDLGDVFIEVAKSGLGNLIIETHSENLLLRIQKRIREGTLDSQEVSIIYVEPHTGYLEDESAKFNSMTNLNLDSAGDIVDPFPETFSDLRRNDLF